MAQSAPTTTSTVTADPDEPTGAAEDVVTVVDDRTGSLLTGPRALVGRMGKLFDGDVDGYKARHFSPAGGE